MYKLAQNPQKNRILNILLVIVLPAILLWLGVGFFVDGLIDVIPYSNFILVMQYKPLICMGTWVLIAVGLFPFLKDNYQGCFLFNRFAILSLAYGMGIIFTLVQLFDGTLGQTLFPNVIDEEIVNKVSAACAGEAIPQAMEFDQDPGIHHLVILSEDGKPEIWTQIMPRKWKPKNLSETELVACTSPVKKEFEYSCSYERGSVIRVYREEMIVRLIAAHTGELVREETFFGEDPEDCPVATTGDGERVGRLKYPFSTLTNWLSEYVESESIVISRANLSRDQEDLLELEAGNGKIVFYSTRGNKLYSMNPDGSDLKNLGVEGFSPDCSPDGKKIVARNPDWSGIFVVSIDGTNKIDLPVQGSLENGYDFNYPHWSPDGKRIVYQQRTSIFAMNADGSNQTQLTPSYFQFWEPIWTPDGKIVFSGSGSSPSHDKHYVIDNDGTYMSEFDEFSEITDDVYEGYAREWAPDKNAYVVEMTDPFDITLFSADGSISVRLMEDQFQDLSPTWCP